MQFGHITGTNKFKYFPAEFKKNQSNATQQQVKRIKTRFTQGRCVSI